ncbi:LOB domain-containing protein 37 [Dichanthelium oligosanthes]|uniref:LOB domain-containing protein 37 n=1 Tax=Dichanthelium oligosanthes TaxID=888268 RepID=A0A1E5W0H8_9POAL|nr:LOB domain-containing protein 37 [Dichanthelium oligosanthes]
MSCNGCRVLRKGCSDACVLRPSIDWIDGAQPQANATVFVAKFFGRAGLVASLAAVPLHHRPALFRSLLYEACGRTINPVSGAIGLMWTGNWDLCQAAADAVLRGESLRALSTIPAAFTDRDMDGLYGNVGVAASSASPENSSSAPSKKRRAFNAAAAAAVPNSACQQQPPAGLLQSCELDLCLTPASPMAGGRRGCGGGASDEYSATTTCEDQGATGDLEARAPALLNLFN